MYDTHPTLLILLSHAETCSFQFPNAISDCQVFVTVHRSCYGIGGCDAMHCGHNDPMATWSGCDGVN